MSSEASHKTEIPEWFNQVLGLIKNPYTQKTFLEEGRFLEWSSFGEGENKNKFKLSYKAEGFSLAEKKAIEEEIIRALSAYSLEYSAMNVFIVPKGVSSFNKPKTTENTAPNTAPASLNVGHGTFAPSPKKIESIKHIVAISSAKGGVGKSTMAVNLAVALASQDLKVGLMDADIYGPSIPILLGERGRPMANKDKKILPLKAHGLSFISFGAFIPEEDPVVWRGPMLGGILNQFLFDVDWGELDYLILDLPPGTGDIQLSLAQNLSFSGALVVSTPQQVALADTLKGIKMFEKLKVPVLGLVENMSAFICETCKTSSPLFYTPEGKGAQPFAQTYGLPLLGKIPFMPLLQRASDQGVPLLSPFSSKENSSSLCAKAYYELSLQLRQVLEENFSSPPSWPLHPSPSSSSFFSKFSLKNLKGP